MVRERKKSMLRKIWPVKIIKIFWVFPIFPKFLSFNSTSKIPLAPRSSILSGQAIFKFTMSISLLSFPDSRVICIKNLSVFRRAYSILSLPEDLARPKWSSNHLHLPTLTVDKLLTSRVCYVVQSSNFSSIENISPGLRVHQTSAAIF